MGATPSKDRTWHTVLFALLAIGLMVGLFKTVGDTPWFSAYAPQQVEEEEPEAQDAAEEKADKQAAKEVAQEAQKAGKAARSSGEGEEKGPVSAVPETEAAVRKKCKNTL
eukprot:11186900-Lingulodinium_polyedra.AAC.1